jgi:hypothetical protein
MNPTRRNKMSQLNIQKCPETGICSIVKPDGAKIDMIPSEAEQLRQASKDRDALQGILEEVDAAFAASLSSEELEQISREFK